MNRGYKYSWNLVHELWFMNISRICLDACIFKNNLPIVHEQFMNLSSWTKYDCRSWIVHEYSWIVHEYSSSHEFHFAWVVFIRTGHFTCGLLVKWFHTSLHQLMQTRQVMVCPTSGQWYPFQHTFGHCFCKVRCLWCIESTSTPKAISSGMALVPVTISLLLQRCPSTSAGKLSHNVYIQQLTARCCQWQ